MSQREADALGRILKSLPRSPRLSWYPQDIGDGVLALGPDIFINAGRNVICYQGHMYVWSPTAFDLLDAQSGGGGRI